MKISEVLVWEKLKLGQRKFTPRTFKWSQSQTIEVEALEEWLRIIISHTDGHKDIISIPTAEILSVEITEMPDDVQPSETLGTGVINDS